MNSTLVLRPQQDPRRLSTAVARLFLRSTMTTFASWPGNCVGSTRMIETRSDLLPWPSPSQQMVFSHSQSGWHHPNFLVPCSPTSFMISPIISRWFGMFNLLDTDDLDLCYSDGTGDTVGMDPLYSVLGALQAFRPEWCRRQDDGLKSYLFTDFNQPYIMRLTCHQKDPSMILP